MVTAKSIRWSITTAIFIIMIFSVITQSELYPLAPYTMYSYPFRPDSFNDLRIFVGITGSPELEITPEQNAAIYPFDEARIKVSINNEQNKSPQRSLDFPGIRKKAQDLLKIIIKNTGVRYDYISLRIYTSKNLNDMRAGKKTVIDQIYEKIN